MMSSPHLATTLLYGVSQRWIQYLNRCVAALSEAKDLHTKVQGIISPPHLATTLIYGVSRRWSQYLNRCVSELSEAEDIHTEVQGVISSPHLATTLLYGMMQWWRHYLNRCVAVFSSEVVEAPRARVPFFLKPITVDMEGGCYVGPILP